MAEEGEAARRPGPVRRNLVFQAPGWLRRGPIGQAYLAGDLEALSRLLCGLEGVAEAARGLPGPPLAVTHLPLRDWRLELVDEGLKRTLAEHQASARGAAIAIRFASAAVEATFLAAARRALGEMEVAGGDVRLAPALHWCPGRGEGEAFGGIEEARRLIRAEALRRAGLDGEGAKVVIVDQGVDATRLPPGSFLGGWWKPGAPGAAPAGRAAKDNRHGTMIAETVLAIAPRARILDCVLIPPRIRGNLPRFLSDAFGAIRRMSLDITLLAQIDPARWKGRWVFVNAWSVYDSRGEATSGEYTRNPEHWLARAIDAAAPLVDIVFAAGNCGQHCPDGRCAEEVIGPGRSILGANSLASVLTVAGVRTDGIRVGYSSEGPGQFPGPDGLPQRKPDIAAPTHFRLPGTAHRLAGGSSAACAVAAGAVAALRERWVNQALPSAALFGRMRATARQPAGSPGWSRGTGHGVLDCAALLAALPSPPGP